MQEGVSVLIAPACQQVPAQVGLADLGGVHADAIRCVVFAGIAHGMGDQRFAPTASLTRGQLASFIARLVDTANAPARLGPGTPYEFVPKTGVIWRVSATGQN
jgi:hypothetical protein